MTDKSQPLSGAAQPAPTWPKTSGCPVCRPYGNNGTQEQRDGLPSVPCFGCNREAWERHTLTTAAPVAVPAGPREKDETNRSRPVYFQDRDIRFCKEVDENYSAAPAPLPPPQEPEDCQCAEKGSDGTTNHSGGYTRIARPSRAAWTCANHLDNYLGSPHWQVIHAPATLAGETRTEETKFLDNGDIVYLNQHQGLHCDRCQALTDSWRHSRTFNFCYPDCAILESLNGAAADWFKQNFDWNWAGCGYVRKTDGKLLSLPEVMEDYAKEKLAAAESRIAQLERERRTDEQLLGEAIKTLDEIDLIIATVEGGMDAVGVLLKIANEIGNWKKEREKLQAAPSIGAESHEHNQVWSNVRGWVCTSKCKVCAMAKEEE